MATVRVLNPMRGPKEGMVLIVFAASRDIMWFNSPKLQTGQEAVFLAHKPLKDEEPRLRATGVLELLMKQNAALVTEPFDVLPASEDGRVRELLSKEVR